MASAFVSKSRRVRFDLTLRILDLNNVPLVAGTSFIKWHLPSSIAAEHRGRTHRCAIRDHRVQYDYVKQIPVRLIVGKDGVLQECIIEFEVLQEYSSGGRGERIDLGVIRINLAEYVDIADLHSPTSPVDQEAAEEGVTRRYLMQDSKINSTLKIGLSMKQTDGTRDFRTPQLRTAPVFGGIAGIISSSEPVPNTHGIGSGTTSDGARDAHDAVPSLSTSRKELGELQDMYRRTLAAHWAGAPGELRADECIEDIFAGGDGWGKNGRPSSSLHAHSSSSGTSTPRAGHDAVAREHSSNGHGARTPMLNFQPHNFRGFDDKALSSRRGAAEISELDVQDDLCSWRIGERAAA
ncbi:uncharacterized protein K489DRAFT_379548 [Dissoconium aciculare CBS 342.82]|uniref:C2 NT-type domain-containing protein n=1 Tax=Dissoconium aciculare CBS 342.82 TaxID=1314786 RepID=A0A6J3M6N4_9PEZI|nr:uncharacterized protein K489DRAFT_379548 [Dissoconium aciculare CBS 342.82]KAF1823553.1 hypothetical protein K489DRAFT_379548 [Dissoconium aciculare CBS 342.82]